uniref:Cell division cycle and apoptosis regulator 1 n=1 Tax=Latimeria chalumnae TaxID=7897 RepID=H3B750_LATCH
MAQFGGQKNPPWATQFTATAVSQPAALGVQQPSLLGASPIYTQQTALAAAAGLATQTPATYPLSQTAALQQQAAAAAAALQQQYQQPQQALYSVQQQLQQPQQALLTQPAVALPTSLSLSTPQPAAQITVSYPAPRSSQQQTQPQKQRVFTGVVTKLHDTFGFVDEDVFFQLSAVKGKTPQVGDRVLVEATYNPNMPFKWNAQRIQTLPNQKNQAQTQPLLKTSPAVLQPIGQQPAFGVQPQPQPQPQSLLQAQISAASITPLLQTQPQPLLQQPQQKAGLLQPPVRIIQQPQPARRLDPSSRFSGRNDRGDSVSNRKDERSRERERERRRSRERSPQRKRSRERSPRRERDRSPRRARRVVPRYTVQFSKFSLDCSGCDMMELRRRYQNLYIPSDFFDAQFTWVDAFPPSRPFQLGNYCNFHIMNREVDPLDKNTTVLDPPDADHLYSAKVMLLASPSMEELYHKSCALAEDSPEVQEGFQHPARLVKFLVGMKGKDEAMAIGGHWSPSLDGADPVNDPSVLIRTAIRCCKALTGIDLSLCTQWYRFAEIRYHRPEETHKGRTVPAHVETVVLFFPDVWHCLPTRSEWESLSRGYKQQLAEKLQAERKEADGEQALNEKSLIKARSILIKTCWDFSVDQVNDLRKELESRNLSSKGLKSQLIARLTKQLKAEEQKEEQKELEKSEKEEEEEEDRKSEDDKEEEERKRQEEVERQRRERRYILPDEPAIIVHPNWAAKNGKFDSSIMSLSVLLDYRLEDNKEHSFEVSLFAELFNEMLQRDFGVRIYKSLLALPDKEEKKEKDKKNKKELEKKEKKEEKEEENGEPKLKRRKSSDEREKKDDKEDKRKEDREKDKKKEDSKDEDENDDDTNQEEYDPMEAEEAEDEDEEERDDEETSRDKREDKREERRRSKEGASKDKDKEKKQMVTFDRDLLMAFVYFDQSHCGYLLEKDLEEILYTLGLHLSRAQVKKLLNKVVVRESCFYRKLTDRGKDEVTCVENKAPQEDVLGNTPFLPCVTVKQEVKDTEENSSLIVYNGAMVDVGSLLLKLEKSERARAEIEQKLQSLETKIGERKKILTKLTCGDLDCLAGALKPCTLNFTYAVESQKASYAYCFFFSNQLTISFWNANRYKINIYTFINKKDVKNEDKDQKSIENEANV